MSYTYTYKHDTYKIVINLQKIFLMCLMNSQAFCFMTELDFIIS